ncbi:MAG: hypothetical protein JXR88_18190 [Clostridia bacterium]|nr:hypothetical protein [Clostridia bacterium]
MRFLKGLLKFIAVVLAVVVVLLGIGWYMISTPGKTIDVTWTESDFESYIAKGGIEFSENHASMEDILAGNIVVTGTKDIDTVVTNSELTAIANKSMNANSVMKDVKIRCIGDNMIEMSAVTGDLTGLIEIFPELEKYEKYLKLGENKPIYMLSSLYYDEATQKFEGYTDEIYLGKLKLPTVEANNNLEDGGTAINNMLKKLDGFEVNSFKVTSEGFQFDGTIPTQIESLGKFK